MSATAKINIVRIPRQRKGVPEIRENKREAGIPKRPALDVARYTYIQRVKKA
jgi:hypothetical protein